MNEFAAGWLGGVAGVLASHPLDTIRTRQAMGQPWRLSPNLYRGFVSPCVSVGVWKAVTLSSHHHIQSLLADRGGEMDDVQLPLWKVTLSACLAGMLSASVCTPFELIKARTMLGVTSSTGLRGALMAELGQLQRLASLPGGLSRNAFRGWPLMMMRDSYSTGVFLGSYEWLHRKSTSDLQLSNHGAAVVAGAIAGPLGWIVCYPFEVTKIAWQSDTKWTKLTSCVAHIYSTGGVRAFFRGLPVCCARSFLQIPVTMNVFETLTAQRSKN